MAYKIRFSKLYGKYQVTDRRMGRTFVLEEFNRKKDAQKFVQENK